jgi:2-polyprenyl-3-methyl-5-hydroxy-6-metoxy-1,4-benzoquinol methylase
VRCAAAGLHKLMTDRSNGYEAIARHFIRARTPTIGPTIVRQWAKRLTAGASILDVGCGYGIPISKTLLEGGFRVYGVDASPTLVDKFREQFPNTHVECSSVEDSRFFDRTFDAVIAWGLIFILPIESQKILIGKVARALNPNGQFLFTATKEPWTWQDNLTDLPSVSLGQEVYEQELAAQGLVLLGNDEDEGGNYYYFATKS